MGPLRTMERREKGVFRAAHPHTPFLGGSKAYSFWSKIRVYKLFSTNLYGMWTERNLNSTFVTCNVNAHFTNEG